MIPRYRAVLFDLDGTLSDPGLGITRSIVYALERLGVAVPSEPALRLMIGPPLRDSFATLLGGRARVEEAMTLYRERYGPRAAIESAIYPGVPELLADLRAAGCVLALATSKPVIFAERILAHFGLSSYFDLIGGATLDTRIEGKEAVVGEVLAQIDPTIHAATVMVGDREHDVSGAHTHGLACIGVTYGFGSRAELELAGADLIVTSVAELRDVLMPAAPAAR